MTSTLHPLGVSLAVALALGCAGEIEHQPQQAATEPKGAGMDSSRAASASPAGLPVGHPPIDTAPAELPAGHPPIATVPSAVGGGLEPGGPPALAWTAPASWRPQPPSSAMRRAQYVVPGEHGDGECVVFYFGPGQGGPAMENAERWARQFDGANGQPTGVPLKTRWEESNGTKVLFAEVSGTYQSGSMMGGGEVVAKPGWALLGAVVEDADGNWFFKFTGPESTVEAERAAFEGMLHSLARGV